MLTLRSFYSFPADLVPLPISRIQSWIAQKRISPHRPITPYELYHSACIRPLRGGVKLLASSLTHDNSIDAQPPLSYPIHVVVSRASKAAIAAVEKAGGSVTTRYYTRFALRKIMRGTMDPIRSLRYEAAGMAKKDGLSDGANEVDRVSNVAQIESNGATTATAPPLHSADPSKRYAFRLPDPTSRKDIEYYRDVAHRGYLAAEVPAGEGPSLFYRTPRQFLPDGMLAKERMKEKKTNEGKAAGKAEENRLW